MERWLDMGILDIFAKPPFEIVKLHMEKVVEGVELMNRCVTAYCDENFTEASKLASRVIIKEREADDLKNIIRESLPKSIFMPVSRGDLLAYIKEQDYIIDRAEEIVLNLEMKKILMPSCIKQSIKNLTNEACNVVKLLPPTLNSLVELFESSFIRRKEEKVHEYISKLDKKEDETACVEQEVMMCIFEWEDKFSCGDLYILIEIVKQLGKMADHAENCGDRIRCMIAKRA